MDWTCLFLCTVNVYKNKNQNKTQCYKRLLWKIKKIKNIELRHTRHYNHIEQLG